MFLITEPIEVGEVDYFLVDIDGAIEKVQPEIDEDLKQARLHYPLDLSFGTHTAKVTGVNAWGEGEPSDPFVFDVTLPSKVYGVGLSVE